MSFIVEADEERRLQARSSTPRLFELDALRGVAAVIVAGTHYLRCFPPFFQGSSAALDSIGFAAVCMFFLLSGFVLSLPYWAGRQTSYGRFVVRRFIRIYIPFLGALGLSIAGMELCRRMGSPSLSPWFQAIWHTPCTWPRLLHWLLIPGMPEVNVAFWTLRNEIVMSALMPLICFVMRRCRAEIWIGLAWAALIVFQGPLDRLHSPIFELWLKTGLLFPAGALLAQKQKPLRRWAEEMGAPARAAIFLGSLLLFAFPLFLGHGRGRVVLFLISRSSTMLLLPAAGVLGSVLFSARLKRVLRHSVMEYLGRISYSLYLVHAIVIAAMLRGLYGRMNLMLLTALIFAATFALAHVYCVWVEEPSIALGRRLTQRRETKREMVVAG
jgi:peptidoglycan/LPS O-acetylase OafA/YrhL